MITLEITISNIQKPTYREHILGIVLSGKGMFKIALTCKEDIPGGRVFELYLLVDKYNEFLIKKYFEAEGDVGYANISNAEKLLNMVKEKIPIEKYYVSPWKIIPALIAYVEGKVYSEKDFLQRIKLRDNRYSKGWHNFFKKHRNINLEKVVSELNVELDVKVV